MENAGVAELADVQDLKSCCRNTVPVRFRNWAFKRKIWDISSVGRALDF